MRYWSKLAAVLLFASAMAFVEAAVVVYLRALYYPEGFGIILKQIPQPHLLVEVAREMATLVMLVTVAHVAGRYMWERFGYFLILFGIWDIFYYVWLKVTLGWPSTLVDWDVLFLIPVPWMGPVIAPVLVSAIMIICGIGITHLYARGQEFRPSLSTWVLAIFGSAVILYSFMRDAELTMQQLPPRPFLYSFLAVGIAMYLVAFWLAYRRRKGVGTGNRDSGLGIRDS